MWHSGTLANGLVGSTRRIPIKEIEAPSPAAAATEAAEAVEEGETREAGSSSTLKDSDTVWFEVDSGGDLLVRQKGKGVPRSGGPRGVSPVQVACELFGAVKGPTGSAKFLRQSDAVSSQNLATRKDANSQGGSEWGRHPANDLARVSPVNQRLAAIDSIR